MTFLGFRGRLRSPPWGWWGSWGLTHFNYIFTHWKGEIIENNFPGPKAFSFGDYVFRPNDLGPFGNFSFFDLAKRCVLHMNWSYKNFQFFSFFWKRIFLIKNLVIQVFNFENFCPYDRGGLTEFLSRRARRDSLPRKGGSWGSSWRPADSMICSVFPRVWAIM